MLETILTYLDNRMPLALTLDTTESKVVIGFNGLDVKELPPQIREHFMFKMRDVLVNWFSQDYQPFIDQNIDLILDYIAIQQFDDITYN